MRKRLLVLAAPLALAMLAPMAAPPTAECGGYCYTDRCYEGMDCGPNCVCVISQGQREGTCVETMQRGG